MPTFSDTRLGILRPRFAGEHTIERVDLEVLFHVDGEEVPCLTNAWRYHAWRQYPTLRQTVIDVVPGGAHGCHSASSSKTTKPPVRGQPSTPNARKN